MISRVAPDKRDKPEAERPRRRERGTPCDEGVAFDHLLRGRAVDDID